MVLEHPEIPLHDNPAELDARLRVRKRVVSYGPRSTAGNAYTYRISLVAAIGGLLFGCHTAIINGAIVFLKLQFGWIEFRTEIAASSLLPGCVLGVSFAGALSD